MVLDDGTGDGVMMSTFEQDTHHSYMRYRAFSSAHQQKMLFSRTAIGAKVAVWV
jgi:hypothetical protein